MKRFNLAVVDPMKESEMDGEILVKYPDYKIMIKVISSIEKPTLKLISDPPLPESQIYAVLLFGRKIDELDSDQKMSVDRAKAGISHGLIGLSSMYVLASTPVEAIDYDPTSKTFSAQVKVAEGTSVTVGASKDEMVKSVGVRKRLGNRWTITTNLSNPSDPSSSVASAMLEWSYRY